MELTAKQKKQRILREIADLFTGAAFPLMIQLIFSASIILFAGSTKEVAIQVVALMLGEVLIMGAYLLFGRQNGIVAVRRSYQNKKKRDMQSSDITAYYGTGEYAVWKGVVIALISLFPYIVFQLIECLAPNSFCLFLLKYAFGWAAFPFILIGEIPSVGQLSEWLNFIWIIIPVAIHIAGYIWGGFLENKRQQTVAEAHDIKGKRRK